MTSLSSSSSGGDMSRSSLSRIVSVCSVSLYRSLVFTVLCPSFFHLLFVHQNISVSVSNCHQSWLLFPVYTFYHFKHFPCFIFSCILFNVFTLLLLHYIIIILFGLMLRYAMPCYIMVCYPMPSCAVSM